MKVALPVFILFATLNVFVFGANMADRGDATTSRSSWRRWKACGRASRVRRMFVVGWVDAATQTTTGISIPCLLSFLAYQDIHATVQGIDSFAPAPTPPINLLFQVYHFMIGPGTCPRRDRAAGRTHVTSGSGGCSRVRASCCGCWSLTVFFGEATITAGWWTAEVGRQPWVVYNVLLTANGVSPVLTALDVVLSLGMFVVLYALLLVLFLYLLNRKIQAGPEPLEDVETVARRQPAGHVPRHLQPAAARGRPGG